MKKESPIPVSEADVLQALSEAGKQYRDYVELAQIAEAASRQKVELLSYQRNWNHPLGLVIEK